MKEILNLLNSENSEDVILGLRMATKAQIEKIFRGDPSKNCYPINCRGHEWMHIVKDDICIFIGSSGMMIVDRPVSTPILDFRTK